MKKWIVIVVTILFVLGAYSTYVYMSAVKNKQPNQEKIISAAKAEAGIVKNIEYDYYHGYDAAAYDVVEGETTDAERWIVWIPKKKGKIIKQKKADGISRQEAVQFVQQQKKVKEVVKVKLGLENDVPLWEVTYIDQEGRYSYCYVDFKSRTIWRSYSI